MHFGWLTAVPVLALTVALGVPAPVAGQASSDVRVLATSKTSTMQKEMSAAAAEGFRFVSVMGGETSAGGKEVVALMQKAADATARYEYKLLATSKTSTLQHELQEAAASGFEFVGQTVFESLFGGKEVAVILERDKTAPNTTKYDYHLVATKRTSTLQKELAAAAEAGYEALAMTVGETAVGGDEIVVITRRKAR
jgi:hypothetical protein